MGCLSTEEMEFYLDKSSDHSARMWRNRNRLSLLARRINEKKQPESMEEVTKVATALCLQSQSKNGIPDPLKKNKKQMEHFGKM